MAAGFAMLALMVASASAVLALPFGGGVSVIVGILAGALAPVIMVSLKFSRFIKQDAAMAGMSRGRLDPRFPLPRHDTPPKPLL